MAPMAAFEMLLPDVADVGAVVLFETDEITGAGDGKVGVVVVVIMDLASDFEVILVVEVEVAFDIEFGPETSDELEAGELVVMMTLILARPRNWDDTFHIQ